MSNTESRKTARLPILHVHGEDCGDGSCGCGCGFPDRQTDVTGTEPEEETSQEREGRA